MFSPSNDPTTTRTRTRATGQAPLVAAKVRLIPRPTATDRPVPRFPRTDRVNARLRVDGRPVVVYIERPRYRIARGALVAAGIATPVAATIAAAAWLIASVVAWVAEHLALLLGGGVALAVVLAALVGLSRSGVACCAGLHCPGCGH